MSAVDDLYQEIILDHYRSPRNRTGELDPHDVHVHHSNPLCGDELDLRLRVKDATIEGIAYDGDGCSISMASVSVMTEAVLGRSLKDADDLGEDFRQLMHGEEAHRADDLGDGVAFSGVAKFPVRVKCALLGWMALRDAIKTYDEGARQHRVTYEET